jgi:hypothetical protein
MEEERYEDVIDAYEKGVGVKPGETLTEYIKRNNIKIIDPEPRTEKMGGGIMRTMLRAGSEPDFPDTRDNPINPFDEGLEEEIDVKELMRDQGIPMGEQVKKKGEGIMQLASEDPEDEKELEFLIEFKEFQDNNPGKTIDDFIEIKITELLANRKAKEEELARITLAGGSFPDLSKDGEITQEDILIGRGVLPEPKRSGGIAGILGV